MTESVKTRVFFALWPDDEVRQELGHIANALAIGGKVIPSQNLHMTLVFVGGVDSVSLECLQRVASSVSVSPFCIKLDRLGSFGAHIVWAGCEQVPTGLLQLQSSLQAALQSECGLMLDSRAFVPHVSLQRELKGAPDDLPSIEKPVSWTVDRFSLIASQLGRSSSSYTELSSWGLA